jgi:tetratricopeptide (TPR) repeat protein
MSVYVKAIERRGHTAPAAGYSSACEGACLDWGLDEQPVLVEQLGSDFFLTHNDTRHRAVIVESAIALRHDANTDVVIVGQITDKGIVFTTPQRGGINGTAEQRCTWTLTPAEVKGPEWALAFVGRAAAHRSYGDHAAMLADLDRSLALHPDAEVAGLKAYVLATSADERVRDGKAAVAAAELARSLVKGEPDLGLYVSLAVAYAEAGDFATAIAHQQKVIEMVPDEAKPQQREHLRLFESGKPFREERRF